MEKTNKDGFMQQQQQVIDFNKILMILVRRWYFIALSVILALVIAHLKLRYSKPLYTALLTFKLDDEKPSQISDFFKYARGSSGKLDNFLHTESEILRSRTLAEKALKAIDYKVSYRQVGQIVTSELYPNSLFRVSFITLDSTSYGKSFLIKFITTDKFEYTNPFSGGKPVTAHVGDTLAFENSYFSVLPVNEYTIRANLGKVTTCTVNNLKAMSIYFSSALGVEIEKGTSILNLRFTSEVPQLAADYVNAVAEVYTDDAIHGKSVAAQQTIDFIESLLDELSDKVKKSEVDLSNFRVTNNAVDLEEEAKHALDRLTSLETEKSILQLKKNLLDKLEKNVTQAKTKTVELIALDQEDAHNLSDLVVLLNAMIVERITLLSKQTASSPSVIDNEKKIIELKSAIVKAIQSTKEKNVAKINFNKQMIDKVNGEISSLPVKQRQLVNIQREFKVNEKVYTYLLEKRLETLITRSSITANANIIDSALTPISPISPKPAKTYLTWFLIGLSGGISIIVLLRLLYQKIPDKETIESISRVPVIGIIKKLHETEEDRGDYEVYVYKGPKTVFSESIRGIRTNMNFILKGAKHKSICVTSSVSGEGKTFCTINLAASLTMLNHKVVIVGCDLRRPKIHLSFKGATNEKGLTTYLIGKSSIDDIIIKTEYENLYIIPAGPTPPNPAELIQTAEMEKLQAYLKEHFDYVFFDTAPVGLVSDSFPLMKYADLNLFIIRAQYSKREFARIPDQLISENGINNLYTVLNSYDSSSLIYSTIYKTDAAGYHGTGGYYYGAYYGGYYGKRYYSQYYSGYYTEEPGRDRKWWQLFNLKKKKRKG